MRKITIRTFCTLIAVMLFSVLVIGQSMQIDSKQKLRLANEKSVDIAIPGVVPSTNVVPSDFDYTNKLVRSDGTKNILWDNGGFITQYGVGSNGSDYSDLQDALGMNSYGASCQIVQGFSIADDFEVVENWIVQTITFFGYQTNYGPPSTLNDIRFQIYDGDPSNGGTVIYGDLSTNKMISTAWTNVWRTLESSPYENKPIMEIVADASGLMLSAGTYWVEWTVSGSGSSGPFCPHVTIVGETTTGNALKNTTGSWETIVDIGPQGLPFIIDGTSSPQAADDLTITQIISPSSGVELGAETVSIKINNFGTNSQSGFEVGFSINGGGTVTETVDATIAPGDYYEYTFNATADLSAIGVYEIEACSFLVGDENQDNDCQTKTIENLVPSFCEPIYTMGCSGDDGFSDFALAEIENYGTACADLNGLGWSQYLSLGPAMLDQGNTYEITMATGYEENYATVWIDFNDDFVFSPEEIVVYNFEMVNGGEMYTVSFEVPADANLGDHMMRARSTWDQVCDDPCAMYDYGEAEDYTVTVVEGIVLDPPTNLVALVIEPNDVQLNWDAGGNTTQLGFNIYRNGAMIDYITETEYLDENLAPGTYEYFTTAIYNEGESEASNTVVAIIPDLTLYPPTNLVALVIEPEDVQLTWGAGGNTTQLGFNIYRDGAMLEYTTETEYLDEDLASGTYEYFTTAVYVEGESEASNTEVVIVGPDGITPATEAASKILMYPNPATDLVFIKSEYMIESVTVYNFAGQIILIETINETTHQVNTSKLNSGIYLFQIITKEGRTSKRIEIK